MRRLCHYLKINTTNFVDFVFVCGYDDFHRKGFNQSLIRVVMKSFIYLVAGILFIVCWLAGIVIAEGVLVTWAAICLPPYAWYLLIERVMILNNLVGC